MENKVERKKKFIINVVFYALIAVLVWVGCKYLVSPMMPFIIAFLVAALIQVPVRKFKVSKKQKKLLSIVFCAVFYGLLLLLGSLGQSEVSRRSGKSDTAGSAFL